MGTFEVFRRMETIPTIVRGVIPVAKIHTTQIIVPMVTSISEEGDIKKDLKQTIELLKDLSLNLMAKTGEKGRGRGPNRGEGGGRGSGRGYNRRPLTCYNSRELGHYSNEQDKPRDMFYLPPQLDNRVRDYGIGLKGEAGPSGL